MLRFVLVRRVQDPASCEVFRAMFTTTDAAEAERMLRSGGHGYGQGFDVTECVGVEVVPDDAARDGKGGK